MHHLVVKSTTQLNFAVIDTNVVHFHTVHHILTSILWWTPLQHADVFRRHSIVQTASIVCNLLEVVAVKCMATVPEDDNLVSLDKGLSSRKG